MKTLIAKINVPKESKKFIRNAADMALAFNARLLLLYTQDPNNYLFGTSGATGSAMAEVQKQLDDLAVSVKKIMVSYIEEVKTQLPKDLTIDYTSSMGAAYRVIQQLVSENKADMVVLESAKNESFLNQTSHNLDISNNVDCPVWIIPKNWEFKKFNNIIYATDYREEDIIGIKRLIGLTIGFSPSITALHLTDNIDFEEKIKEAGFLEMMKTKTAYNHLKIDVLNFKDIHDSAMKLNDYALEKKSDLIVVLKENKSFLERIFQANHTKNIVKKSVLPVLIFHEKHRTENHSKQGSKSGNSAYAISH